MKKVFQKSMGVYLLAIGLGAGAAGSGYADEATQDFFYSTPFDSCFYYGYDSSKVSGHQAFETAECISSLVSEEESANLGASKMTLLRYASIWYGIAAASGVEQAKAKLVMSDEALRNYVQSKEALKAGKSTASLTNNNNSKNVVSVSQK